MTALPNWYDAPPAPRPPSEAEPADPGAVFGLALDPVEEAVRDIAEGRPVVVVDDESRENEGDLVVAAELITAETVAFMMSECRGLICTPMEGADLDRLALPQMVAENTESMGTAFTVSVDATGAHGVTTGISAADRAATIRLLADPGTVPADFVRPGHAFPLRARPGGVLARAGHTEAGVDLARLAGLRPAAAIVEIAGEDGTMLRLPELVPFVRTQARAADHLHRGPDRLPPLRRAHRAARGDDPAAHPARRLPRLRLPLRRRRGGAHRARRR